MGVLLLVVAFSLLLVLLMLGGQAVGKWKNLSIIAAINGLISIHWKIKMELTSIMVIRGVCLILFPVWEMWKKAAPTLLLTLRLFKNRTLIAGCVLGFFFFSEYHRPVA